MYKDEGMELVCPTARLVGASWPFALWQVVPPLGPSESFAVTFSQKEQTARVS